jgi:hypothetical protein
LENEEYNGESLEREDIIAGYSLTVIVEEWIVEDDEEFYEIEYEVSEEWNKKIGVDKYVAPLYGGVCLYKSFI